MSIYESEAISHPNIALIKYWGNQNPILRIPANNSISINLGDLFTRTRVQFDIHLSRDDLVLNERRMEGRILERMSQFLDHVRRIYGQFIYASVTSENNFPMSAGIASSASAFSALALASVNALNLALSEKELSILARKGSGSACRSIPDGFVEWISGTNDEDSFAYSLAPEDHWDLVDCIAIIQTKEKEIGSSEGQNLAYTSPLQPARIQDSFRRLDICRAAILHRDFEQLASIVELDSNMMHSIMLTSTPVLMYWKPGSIQVMHQVLVWRKQGIPVCYTLDAGPNVHVLTLKDYATSVKSMLQGIPGVLEVLTSRPGSGARLVNRLL